MPSPADYHNGSLVPQRVPSVQRTESRMGSAQFTDPLPEQAVIGSPAQPTAAPRGLPREDRRVTDTVLDGADVPADTPRLFIRGAALRGDAHRYHGMTRQDALNIRQVSDDRSEAYVGCVANGVGSESLSQYGAELACRAVQVAVGSRLSALWAADRDALPRLCQEIVAEVARKLNVEARNLRAQASELSTTLVAAVVEAEPTDPAQRRCIVLRVGDSSAFLLTGGQFQPVFGDSSAAENTSGATSALPAAFGQVEAHSATLAPGEALVVCTDGLSNPLLNPETGQHLAALWDNAEVPSILQFGNQLSFRIESYDDDRTAVCFWNR